MARSGGGLSIMKDMKLPEDGAADVFGPAGGKAAEPVVGVKALHAKIGEKTDLGALTRISYPPGRPGLTGNGTANAQQHISSCKSSALARQALDGYCRLGPV
jgi:hypothetical protein